MKLTKLFILLSILFASLTFSSCSDDDDDDKDGGNNGIENNDNNSTFKGANAVFDKGFIKSIGNNIFAYEDNRLKAINGYYNITFDYSKENQVTMRTEIVNPQKDEENFTTTFHIGSNGFAEKAEIKEDGGNYTTFSFKYNTNNQIVEVESTEVEKYEDGDETEKESLKITYDKNGNISKVEQTNDIEGDVDVYITEYTYDLNLKNEGQLFSVATDFLGQIQEAYFAGLLGKGTSHLPITYKSTEESYEYSYKWNTDEKNRPIKQLANDSNYESFEWAN